jgi:hypothetical protein
MQSSQEALAKLEAIVCLPLYRDMYPQSLVFTFDPRAEPYYGPWQAALTYRQNMPTGTTDPWILIAYGQTLDEASADLLARIEYPEQYPETVD